MRLSYRHLKAQITKNPKTSVLVGLLVAVIALPAVFMLAILIRYSVNIPFWDQWVYVDTIKKFHEGTLTLFDLWKQHNEHRYALPRLVVIGSYLATGWNIRFEVIDSGLFATGTAALLITMAKKLFSRTKYLFLLL